ncbi:hypothetical protein P9112_004472 [Eukaryota sp. TZLM1-RC]
MVTQLKCNKCWQVAKERAYTTVCGHFLCVSCIDPISGTHSSCPGCEYSFLKSTDIQEVQLSPDSSIKRILCGYPPDLIMEMMKHAILFWNNQRDIDQQYTTFQYKRELSRVGKSEQQLSDQLVEHKNQLNRTRNELDQLKEDLQKEKRERAEMSEKYAERSRQKRQYQELYEELKTKLETGQFNHDNQHPSIINQKQSNSFSLASRIVKTPKLRPPSRAGIFRQGVSITGVKENLNSGEEQPAVLKCRGDRFSVLRNATPLSKSSGLVNNYMKTPAFSFKRPMFTKNTQ